MAAAREPIQRPSQANLLAVGGSCNLQHLPRSSFVDLLRPGDLVIANDAATLPASHSGKHLRTGRTIEVRLAGMSSLRAEALRSPMAIIFGAGDFHMRTEDRPMPPELAVGDRLALGPLRAAVAAILGHPRLVRLAVDGKLSGILGDVARHGRTIQKPAW